mmetsp:Transcript_41115/g.89629  ORF Transcript_41115/g.89629 Transcript_41115/m.89629 type:complete len:90 (+) Transcript_41115:399-668(+)
MVMGHLRLQCAVMQFAVGAGVGAEAAELHLEGLGAWTNTPEAVARRGSLPLGTAKPAICGPLEGSSRHRCACYVQSWARVAAAVRTRGR